MVGTLGKLSALFHGNSGSSKSSGRRPSVVSTPPSTVAMIPVADRADAQHLQRWSSLRLHRRKARQLDHSLTTTRPNDDKSPQSPPSSAVTGKTGPALTKATALPAKRDAAVADHRHRQQPLHHRDAQRLQRAQAQLQHVIKGFDAVTALLQYLVHDMDALSTTTLKRQLDANRNDLVSAKCSLDDSEAKCVQLQKENEKHRIDLEMKDALITEITASKEMEIYELEKKLQEQAVNLKMQFSEELNRLKNASEEEKMKLILSHDQRVVELQQANKLEMSQIRKYATEKQIELGQKISVLESERDLLKSERDALKEENQRLIEDKKLQNTSLGYQKLCNEIESLRTVLELKSSEMQELRKLNERLQREAEDLPAIIQKYEAAQSRVEDLNVQLQRKSEIEMQLSQEKDKMAREICLEKQKKKRLSCHNEELLWKLKKSTEVANHLAVSTKRLSQTPQDLAAMKEAQTNYQRLCRDSSNSENSGGDDDGCGGGCGGDDDDDDGDDTVAAGQLEVGVNGPARIMGVMKKNDSVSYVFGVDEEPSEIATRLVRRASSLRSVGKSRARGRESVAEKRSRASSHSGPGGKSAAAAAERDQATAAVTVALVANSGGGANHPGHRYCSSDCFTCSSDSSNSSPEHRHNHRHRDDDDDDDDDDDTTTIVVYEQQNRGDRTTTMV